MSEQRHVKLFRNGRNQAVRIPVEFELPGDDAIMHREGERLVIEPVRKRGLVALLKAMKPIEESFPEIDDPVPAPERVQLLAIRGRAHLYLGNIDEARAAFNAALAIDPKFTDALLGQGLVDKELGNLAGAREWRPRPRSREPRCSSASSSRRLERAGRVQDREGRPVPPSERCCRRCWLRLSRSQEREYR